MVYARDTTVSVIRTRMEIEETLQRYGADGFAYATEGDVAMVMFSMEGRRIRFVLQLPDPGSSATPTTSRRGRRARPSGRRTWSRLHASGGGRSSW